MIDGIDVSEFQGHDDFVRLARQGFGFVLVRATIGLGVDPLFHEHAAAAQAAGLKVGAYHAFETNPDPIAQAEHFFAIVGNLDICPFLDFEGGCKGLAAGVGIRLARTFCEHADSLFAKQTGLYTYRYFWGALVSAAPDEAEWFADRPFWEAYYEHDAPYMPAIDAWPSPFVPFKRVDLWQFSGDHGTRVEGVNGPCDRDRFNGTIDDLLSLGAPIAAEESAPCEPDAPLIDPWINPRVRADA